MVFTRTAAEWDSCSGVQEGALAGSNVGMGQVRSCESAAAFLVFKVP